MKRTFRIALAVGLLAVLAAGPIFPLGSEAPLSLEQARSAALSGSTTLRKALLVVDSAQLAQKTQGYARLPSISAGASASLSYPAASLADSLGVSLSVSLSQTVYAGGSNAIASAIEAISTQSAREQARAEYFRVVEAVDSAYYGTLETQAALEAARSDLQAAQAHLALAQARLEAGMITRFAFLETEAQEAAKQTALAQARGALSTAESELSSLTGLRPPLALAETDLAALGQVVERLAALGTESTATFIGAVTEAAAANNPSLTQARLAGRQAALSVDLAASDYLPSLSASYRHALGGRVGDPAGLGAGEGSLSLSASIPLDVWKTKAAVAEKRTAAEQTQLDVQETLRALGLEVRAAVYDSLSSARAAVSAAKALEFAEGYYQSVLELYRLGSAAATELSDAQALVSTNRTALISARYGLLTRLAGLRTLAGLESDASLVGMIP